MAEKLNQWLDRFVEKGANPDNVNEWPDEMEGDTTQSDWNQQDDTQPDFIKNKPNIDGQIETKLNNEVLNLIKTDVQGNVFINTGFQDAYTLATEFDESAVYYESYIPIDPTKLAGTWRPDNTKTPSELTRVSKTFSNEGDAMVQSGYNYIYYLDSINPYSGSIINYMNVHGYNGGERVTNSQPMVVVNQWNVSGLAFTIEDSTMFDLMTNFFVKVSETVLSDELLTVADVIAYDQAHPHYREITLTPETFVPNTYYTLEKTPTWVNVQDLLN